MSSKVQGLAPTDGIKDPQVRAFADSLSNAWQLRNGNTGADDKQRFITKEEWDLIAKNPNIRALASIGQPGSSTGPGGGEPGPGDSTSGGGGGIVVPGWIQNLVDFLASGITLVNFTQIQRTSNDLFAQVYALTSRARDDVTGIWAAIETLNTIVIGPDSADADNMVGMIAVVEGNVAMIGHIENVHADSVSVNASTLAGQVVQVGLKAKVFVQPTAPPLVTGTPPNEYTLKANDLWIDPSRNNQMFRWTGTIWEDASDKRIAFSSAGITTESTTRASSDSALAKQIETFWAQVGSDVALFQETTNVIVPMPGVAIAEKFVQVQSSVIDPNTGENLVAAVTEDLDTEVKLQDGRAKAGYTLKVQAGSGGINAIAGMSLTANIVNGVPDSACVFFVDNFLVTNRLHTNIQTAPFVINADGVVRMNVTHITDHIRSDEFFKPGTGGYVNGKGWKIDYLGNAEFYGLTTLANLKSGSVLIDRDSGQLLNATAVGAWTKKDSDTPANGNPVSPNGPPTHPNLKFVGPGGHGISGVDQFHRVRQTDNSGILLATTVQFMGVADDRITLWTRYSTLSAIGNWVALPGASTSTPQDSYGAVTCGWAGYLGMAVNGYYEFGVTATYPPLYSTRSDTVPGTLGTGPYDSSKVELRNFTLTVTMSNL